MNTRDTIFVGLKGQVVAHNKWDGTRLWNTKLTSGFIVAGDTFVTVIAEEKRIYAHTHGQLFCLDAATGEILWTNELAGLGYGVAMLAVAGLASLPIAAVVEQQHRNAS